MKNILHTLHVNTHTHTHANTIACTQTYDTDNMQALLRYELTIPKTC